MGQTVIREQTYISSVRTIRHEVGLNKFANKKEKMKIIVRAQVKLELSKVEKD
jgi:hypothetical protein